MSPAADDWFVATTPRPGARVAILAFPHAGAGCAAFAGQARALPPDVELATLNLPGRQARYLEPPRTDLAGLVTELADSIAGRGAPYVLFGYCSGASLAYLVAGELVDRGAELPRRLVVGSYPAPGRAGPPALAALSRDALWETLVAGNAVPTALADQVELRELSEPAIRADFALVAAYEHRERPPLPIPVTVVCGERDGSLTAADLAGWDRCTTAVGTVRRLPAGHWFMEEAPVEAVDALAAECRAAVS